MDDQYNKLYDQVLLSYPTLRDYIVAYIGYEHNPEKLIDLLFAMETDITC